MCELYKDTFLTIRVNGRIFYGPIKQLYKTFYDKVIEVFYDGKWFPAKIIGEASEKNLIKLTEHFICSPDLKLKINKYYIDKKLSELLDDDIEVELNTYPTSAPMSVLGYYEPEDILRIGKIGNLVIDEKSDWLFGIQFEDPNNKYYTLTNGIIISAK